MTEELERQLADIERVIPSLQSLQDADNEGPFVGAAVDLLVEIGSLVCVAAHIYPNGKIGWTRDQAIVGGHIVRLFKLIDALMDQTCKNRRETTMVFCRLAFETIVNLVFLCRHGNEDVYRSYVEYSMRHEKKLLNRIRGNISDRNDVVLPIEDRMMKSIQRKCQDSGIDIEHVDAGTPKPWAGKNLFEKAKAVGMDEVYMAAFGGGSHSVHGNWMDLLEYHLSVEDGAFHPDAEWSRPRPQVLLALAKLTVEALSAYFDYLGHIKAREHVDERLSDVWERVRQVDHVHEAYLQRD